MLGKQILNYKINHLIGAGGMVKVYEAKHIKLDNKVAIKILDDFLVRKSNIRERFMNEAKIMASLDHPNITRVTDFEEDGDMLAIVMELVKGIPLSEYIKKRGGLDIFEAIEIQKILLKAFAYAHHRGIVHRDVKPSNVIINPDKDNRTKILDFGIAKLIHSDVQLTGTGMQMGTPLYMSPEQVDDSKRIDHRSDIYSLGVLFYTMLSGIPPYDVPSLSNFTIFNKIVNDPLPKLDKPNWLNNIIKIATAKNPNERYQSCEEFFLDVENMGKDFPMKNEKVKSVSKDDDRNEEETWKEAVISEFVFYIIFN